MPSSLSKIAARLRIAGALILLLGLVGAGVVWWTGKSPEDLSSDPSTARDYKLAERSAAINYGQTGVLAGELLDDLKHPGVQAVLILMVSALAASGCFYAAVLVDRRDRADRRVG